MIDRPNPPRVFSECLKLLLGECSPPVLQLLDESMPLDIAVLFKPTLIGK
jgi:hypothetical protein